MFILSFRSTDKIYPSKFLLFYMSTDVPVHQYTCAQLPFNLLLFQLQTHTCHHNYLCIWPYMCPFMTLPVHFHAFIPINPSTFLLLYIYTDAPVHQYTVKFISSFLALYSSAGVCTHRSTRPFYSSAGVCTHRSTRK